MRDLSLPAADIASWIAHYPTIERALRFSLDTVLDRLPINVSKYGPRAAPAVYAVIFATTDFATRLNHA